MCLELRAERLSEGSAGTTANSTDHDSALDLNPWMGLRPLADLLETLRESRADKARHPAAGTVGRVCGAIIKQVVLLDEQQLEGEGLEVRTRPRMLNAVFCLFFLIFVVLFLSFRVHW